MNELHRLVEKLRKEGWESIGGGAMAKSTRDTNPPYFWQAMRRTEPSRARPARRAKSPSFH